MPKQRKHLFCPECGGWWPGHNPRGCDGCGYRGYGKWMSFAKSEVVATSRPESTLRHHAIAARYGESI